MTKGARFAAAMTVLTALLFAAAVAAVSVGSTGLRFVEAGRALVGMEVPPEVRDIVSYRIGRVLLAGIVGMSLAAAGTALQALLRNPLADPYILGVSGGGALAAALFITFGGAVFSPFAAAISRSGFWALRLPRSRALLPRRQSSCGRGGARGTSCRGRCFSWASWSTPSAARRSWR